MTMTKPEDDFENMDPELRLEALRSMAREATVDLTPILIEKAINGKTSDALKIWEAFADRSGFTRETQNPAAHQGPLISLNIAPTQLGEMLGGLQTMTGHTDITKQNEHNARIEENPNASET